MPNHELVELEKSQYPLRVKHYVETYNALPWNDQWTEALSFKKISEMMDCRGAFGLVCHDDNDNFAGVIFGDPKIYFNCKQFFIKDFFVALPRQGKGIGSALMTEFEKRLSTMGIDKIYLFASKGEKTEDFYQNCDFHTWGGMVLTGKSIYLSLLIFYSWSFSI